MADPRGEPTMEEILASIRRIIAEDPAPPRAPVPRKSAARGAPQPVEADAPIVSGNNDFEAALRVARDQIDIGIPPLPPQGEPFAAEPATDFGDEDDEVLELAEFAEVAGTAEDPAILSATVASAAAERLSRLSEAVGQPEAGSITLDALVREMLRPMLKDWLDNNLPDIVDQIVSREIARLTGKGR